MRLPTASADIQESRADHYCGQLGVPLVRRGGVLVAKAGGGLAGLTMPAGLGGRVRTHLDDRGIAVGPIVAHVRAHRWTFLVDWAADADPGVGLDAELMRWSVTVVRAGGEIALPSPGGGSIRRDWITNPHTVYRPSMATVVESIRHCAGTARAAGVTRPSV
ncbi:DNA-directed RNA polymerase subunit beta [Nocardia blacklockiae]|uniref:DNA-directed RNA polymerase subunit beta n=1 Tax=Nocardia blacklockiae TaxID=480036 RepID=UPI001895DE41|nr:DNA-directed RNA polymerase subunit beta [Nocardia blacklockiae]MBF6176022.1 DNA-directed RNA polymerase subunit beta [Nocardia blacklockiae]